VIPDYRRIISALADRNVEFVIVGAVALVLHGSGRVTRDLDICYARDRANLKCLAAALAPLHPTLRGAPAGLPFSLDWQTLESGLNFTLTTDAGDVDLLGELAGIGTFRVVARLADHMDVYGQSVKVLSLEGLEKAKRAAGRLKDLVDLAEILELRRQTRR
jgi:predicted nucleotidyltransferase